MGRDLYDHDVKVKELFDMAEETTGIDLTRLCFEGPMTELTQTINLQPAITVVNLACLGLIETAGIKPDFTAGHSLGEYSALSAAGAISRTDTFKLVNERGRLMHREAEKHKGAMSAIIGLTIDTVQSQVIQAQLEGTVSVATFCSCSILQANFKPKSLISRLNFSGSWRNGLCPDSSKKTSRARGIVSKKYSAACTARGASCRPQQISAGTRRVGRSS